MTSPTDLPVLIFDGDCGFCTSSANKAREWLRLPRVEPWQHADLPPLGLTPHECNEALQWVGVDGEIHSGHAAVAAAMRFRGGLWGVLGRVIPLPVINILGSAAYRVIARNRHRLPGGTPACAIDQTSAADDDRGDR